MRKKTREKEGWKLGDYYGPSGEGDEVNLVLRNNRVEWEAVSKASNHIVVKGDVFWVLHRESAARPMGDNVHPPKDCREKDIRIELCDVLFALTKQQGLFSVMSSKANGYLAKFSPRVQVLMTWIRDENLSKVARYVQLLLKAISEAKGCTTKKVATELLVEWWGEYINESKKEQEKKKGEKEVRAKVEEELERMTIDEAATAPLPSHLGLFD